MTGVNQLSAIGFPGILEFPLFAEGTFVFLDGGTLDIGLVRDE